MASKSVKFTITVDGDTYDQIVRAAAQLKITVHAFSRAAIVERVGRVMEEVER